VSAAGLAGPAAWAQATAPSAELRASGKETPITLSPFVIEATSDTGYLASTTLSGSRLKTDYRDVASQVTVMTPEFLADIGAFTADDAFTYSANTETGMELAGIDAQFFGRGATINSPQSRTRGIAEGTSTRNFFTTSIPYDNYNAAEGGFTMASGPNAGLFGLGSASGINDTQFNRAQLTRSKARTQLVLDRFGSRRVSVDANAPLLQERLGVRVEGLWSDKRYFMEGYYAKDKRVTGSVGWSPFKRLRVDVHSEFMDRRASLPVYFMTKDSVTPWTNPGMGNRLPFDSPDRSPDAQALSLNPGSNAYLLNWVAGVSTSPIFTHGATDAPGIYNYRYSAAVRQQGQYIAAGLKLAPDYLGGATFLDDRIYPFQKYGIYGGTHPNLVKGKTVTALGNLQITDHLFMEFGANYEATKLKNTNKYSPVQANLSIDPNTYRYKAGYTPLDPAAAGATGVANRAANAANREANPNFNKLYLEGQELANLGETEAKEVRAALAYEFDAARRLGGWWAKLAGRQRFVATASESEVTTITQVFRRIILDDVDSAGRLSAPSVITAANAKADFGPTARYMTATNRAFLTRDYLDPSNPSTAYGTWGGLDPFETWTFNDATGKPYRVGLFEQGGVNVATGRKATDFSRALVYQGYFLKDRLVLTYSRRYDSTRNKQYDPVVNSLSPLTGLAPVYSRIPWDRFESNPTLINTSRSAVVHPFNWLSFHYNQSTNNDPSPSAAHNIDGSLYPFPSGQNAEYGVRFVLGGLTLRVNQYKNEINNQDAGNNFGNIRLRQFAFDQEARYINLQRSRAQALRLPDFSDYYLKTAGAPGYNPADNAIDFYRLYANAVSRGTEIELGGRWRKLDLRFSVGRTTAVKSNIGPAWLKYATDAAVFKRMQDLEWYALDSASGQIRPVISKTAAGAPIFGAPGATPIKGWQNIPITDAGTNTLLFDQYRNSLLPEVLIVQKFEGIANPGIREWRFSSTLAYNLSRAWRAGFSTRLRAKAVIGYMLSEVNMDIAGYPVATRTSDLNQRFYSPSEWYFDPFISYKGRLSERLGLTVQLNIRNVLNNRELIPNNVSASTSSVIDVNDPRFRYYGWTNPKAIVSAAQMQEPRAVQLSVTVDF
jgi:hypothetical protein